MATLAALCACSELPSSSTLLRSEHVTLNESFITVYDGPPIPGDHGTYEIHLQLSDIAATDWFDTFEYGQHPLTARITTEHGTTYLWNNYGSGIDVFITDHRGLDGLATKIELAASPPLRVRDVRWVSHSGP